MYCILFVGRTDENGSVGVDVCVDVGDSACGGVGVGVGVDGDIEVGVDIGVGVGVVVGDEDGPGDKGVGVGVDGDGDKDGPDDNGVGVGVGVDGDGEKDDRGDNGVGVGVHDLFFLRDKIKSAVGQEKVQGCLLLLHAWEESSDKKSYSSLKTFMAKSVRPVCNCLCNHHGGNIDLFVTHHDIQNSIHNFYKKCRGNINSSCVSD